MKTDFYHYHRLQTEEEKRVYMSFYRGLVDCQKRIDCGRTTAEDFSQIQEAIVYDHPSLFYFKGYTMELTGNYLVIRPHYVMSKFQIEQYQKQLTRVTNSFLRKANVDGKDNDYILEKVHDMLAEKVNYDNAAIDTLTVEHQWFAHTILGVLLKKEAVCDGISKTYKFLLNHLGVSCIVITGCTEKTKNSPQATHAWNMVKKGADREKLHVDVTWDINGSAPGHIRRDFFCLTEQEIRKTHFNFET